LTQISHIGLLLLFLLFPWKGWGQQEEIGTPEQELDWVYTILEQDSVLHFLLSEQLIPSLSLSEFEVLEPIALAYQEKIGQQGFQRWIQGKQRGRQISNQHFFTYGDSLSTPGGAHQWYSDFGMACPLPVKGIPLQVQGNAIFSNGQFQPHLSTVSVQFDPQQYLEGLRKQVEPNMDLSDFLQDPNALLDLSPLQQDMLDTELAYALYKQIIQHPNWVQTRLELQQQVETLRQESLNHAVLDTLQVKLHQMDQVVQLYRGYWNTRKEIDFEVRKMTQAQIQTKSDQWSAASDPRRVRERLLQNKELSIRNQFLLRTKALDLGLFNLDDSDLTAQFLTLNGVQYAYDDQTVFGRFAYGSQSLTTRFLPSLNALWLDRYLGRRFLFAQIGFQGKDSEQRTQVSFLKGEDRGNPSDTSYTLPRNNWVLSWSGQMKLAKQTYLQTQIALSDQDLQLGVIQDDEDQQLTSDKLSVALDLKYRFEALPIQLEAGYFYHGPQFYTMGNPFLLTNRQGIHLKTAMQALKDRLTVSLDGRMGQSIAASDYGFQDLQLLGTIQYRFKKQHLVSVQILPNVYQQHLEGFGEMVRSDQWIYSVQGQLFHTIKEAQLISVWSVSNLQNQFVIQGNAVADPRTLRQFTYLFWQEMLLFERGHQIQFKAVAGIDDWVDQATVTEALVGLGFGFPWKSWSFNLGGEILDRQVLNTWQYGGYTNLQWDSAFGLGLQFNMHYRRPFKPDAGGSQVFGNLTLQCKI